MFLLLFFWSVLNSPEQYSLSVENETVFQRRFAVCCSRGDKTKKSHFDNKRAFGSGVLCACRRRIERNLDILQCVKTDIITVLLEDIDSHLLCRFHPSICPFFHSHCRRFSFCSLWTMKQSPETCSNLAAGSDRL